MNTIKTWIVGLLLAGLTFLTMCGLSEIISEDAAILLFFPATAIVELIYMFIKDKTYLTRAERKLAKEKKRKYKYSLEKERLNINLENIKDRKVLEVRKPAQWMLDKPLLIQLLLMRKFYKKHTNAATDK